MTGVAPVEFGPRDCTTEGGTPKQRFATRRRAEKVLDFAVTTGGNPHMASCHVYECPTCGGWHIGRPHRRSKRAGKAGRQ